MFSKFFSCCSFAKNSLDDPNFNNIQTKDEKILSEIEAHLKNNIENKQNITENGNNNNFYPTSLEQKIKDDELNNSNITFSNIKVKDSKSNTINFDTEVLSTQELKLIGEIFWNKEIYIDRLGLKSGKRKKKNGIVIFGLGKNEENIDFVLNIPKSKIKNNDKFIQIFSIEYDKIEERFVFQIIKDDIKILNILDEEFFLENNQIIELFIGKIQMFIDTSNSEKGLINIKIENKKYDFNKIKDLPITIGRNNCKINIKNNSISKNHAVIDYNNESNMFFIKDLGSTNKTYFVLKFDGIKSLKINKDMNFKIFESKFSIKIIE